jgi:hypothetical protein
LLLKHTFDVWLFINKNITPFLAGTENGTSPGSHQDGSALSHGRLEAEDSASSEGHKHTSPTKPGAGTTLEGF